MADLLPSSPDTSAAEGADPRVIGVDSDDADDLIAALSSGTARALLAALHDEPANPAKLADAVDTTIQNAQYHLGKLEDAGMIEVIDTVYSEKGREMQVYAPSDRPLVVVAGREEQTSGLQAALSRLLGAFAALALGSVIVQRLLSGDLFSLGASQDGAAGEYDDRGAAGGGAGTSTEAAGDMATGKNATGSATPAADGGTKVSETTQSAATGTATPRATGTPTEAPQATGTPTPAPEATPTPTGTPVDLVEQTASQAPEFAAQVGPDVAPGLLFFAGGAAVLVVGFAYRYARSRR